MNNDSINFFTLHPWISSVFCFVNPEIELQKAVILLNKINFNEVRWHKCNVKEFLWPKRNMKKLDSESLRAFKQFSTKKSLCRIFTKARLYYNMKSEGVLSFFNTLTQQRQRKDIIAESHSIPASYYFFVFTPPEEFHLEIIKKTDRSHSTFLQFSAYHSGTDRSD
jgi:hypothetical protein